MKRVTKLLAVSIGMFLFSCGDTGVNVGGNDGGGGGGGGTYTLTVNSNPFAGGTVSRNPNLTSYAQGSTVTITAVPASGYVFRSWTGTGAANTNMATTTVSMTANRTITANFDRQTANNDGGSGTYTLTVNSNPLVGGTVQREPSAASYTEGAIVTIRATPASGYVFRNWTGTGVANPNMATTTVNMTANRTITANFDRQTANAVVITLTSWESRVSDAGGPDPRVHFRVVAMQGTSVLSTNTTSYLLNAQDIGQSWFGSRASAAIPFNNNATRLEIRAVVVEKDLFFDDDISPREFLSINLPVYPGDRNNTTLGTSTATESRVGFNYEFRRQ